MSHYDRLTRTLAATWIHAMTTGVRIATERDARAELEAAIIAIGAGR